MLATHYLRGVEKGLSKLDKQFSKAVCTAQSIFYRRVQHILCSLIGHQTSVMSIHSHIQNLQCSARQLLNILTCFAFCVFVFGCFEHLLYATLSTAHCGKSAYKYTQSINQSINQGTSYPNCGSSSVEIVGTLKPNTKFSLA